MASRKRKQSGSPTNQPSLKRRNIEEVLSEAPQEWRLIHQERKARQEELQFYRLSPDSLNDKDLLNRILKYAKEKEISGTRYRGFCQTSQLFHLIEDFPLAVTNPFVKVIGPDELYGYCSDSQKRHKYSEKRYKFHEREIHRLRLLMQDNILDALRLYGDLFAAWSAYCKNVLGSTPLAETKKYVLSQRKKSFIPELLRDAEFLRVKLNVTNPWSSLEPSRSVEESIYPDLRSKLVNRRALKDLANFQITVVQEEKSSDVPAVADVPEVPHLPASPINVHQEEAHTLVPTEAAPLEDESPSSKRPCLERGFCLAPAQGSCPKSCCFQFVKGLTLEECEEFSDPPLQTESYAQVKIRDSQHLRSGPFQCIFKNMNRIPPVVVLAPNPENFPGDPQMFFTDAGLFWERLEKLKFQESILQNNYMAVDTEGINSPKWLRNHSPQGKPTLKTIAYVHFAAKNGVCCGVHCLFDGFTFHGAPIPIQLLELLRNPNVMKVGSGVSHDLQQLNDIFNGQDRKFSPSLEVSRLLMWLQPVDKYQLGSNEKPPNGKRAAANYLGVGYLLDENRQGNIKACFIPHSKHFDDYSKNPRKWRPKMFLYNRLDRFLGLALIDSASIKLTKMYNFIEQPQQDIGLVRLSLFSILGDFKVFQTGNEDHSEFIFPPMTLLKGYSPLRQYRSNVGYPPPMTIMANLRRLMGNRRLPANQPMMFESEWSETQKPNGLTVKEFDSKTLKDIPFPHSCSECGSYDHQEKDCDSTYLLLDRCRYPLCNGEEHTILNCPILIHRCTICKEVGHTAKHHEDSNFDILKGWVTRHAYSSLHRFAGIMNSKSALSEILETL